MKRNGDGALVRRHYRVTMPDGQRARLEFTLEDPSARSIAADVARLAGASVYGLVAVAGVNCPPRYPLLWIQQELDLYLAVADDDRVGEDLQAVIGRHLGTFFSDIHAAAIALVERERSPATAAQERVVH